jgi:hypothetical protein
MADALVELAEAIYSLRGKGLPAPCHAGLVIQFHQDPFAEQRSDEQVAADIDRVGLAVIATPGSDDVMTNGRSIHYRAAGQVGPVHVTVFQALARTAVPAEGGEAK